MLRLVLLAATIASSLAQTCITVKSPLDGRSTGTDYVGTPNISVVPAATMNDCCDACLAEPKCNASIWHNLIPPTCTLKVELGRPVKGNRVEACRPSRVPPAPAFRFSGAHSDHMVLQAAPSAAAVWGFCEPGDEITVRFNEHATAAVLSVAQNQTIWTAALPATKASFTAYTISAHSKLSSATITLADVLFGDVWVCSGQSNMAYSLNGSNGNSIVHPPVNNSAAEFADMANYPHIRMIRAGKQKPSSPLLEPHPNDPGGSMPAVQGWTPPCIADGICRVDFSSMCYFFGRDIYDSLAKHDTPRPVGLIGTYWGGTADELWSSPEALKVRPTHLVRPVFATLVWTYLWSESRRWFVLVQECLDPEAPVPVGDSSLWYGMATPFVRSTIKGAIWYQGEGAHSFGLCSLLSALCSLLSALCSALSALSICFLRCLQLLPTQILTRRVREQLMHSTPVASTMVVSANHRATAHSAYDNEQL